MSERKLKGVDKAAGGRPAKISREQIFEEARLLGVGELSFSRLAERLGVRESALYHRFKSREGFLNALSVELAKEFSLPPESPKQWRPWLEATALRFFDFLVANPVVLEVSNWRGLAQFGMPIAETVMETLKAAGYSGIDAGRAWVVASDLAYAQARLVTDLSRAGPMPVRVGSPDELAGRPVPLLSAYVKHIGADPREQLIDTLRWVVAALPPPRT